jgi:hypothetical protein
MYTEVFLSSLFFNFFVLSYFLRFEDAAVLDIEITVFWDVTSCSIVDINLSATPVASASRLEDFQVVPLIACK